MDDLVRLTGYNRNYAARVLRDAVFGPRHPKPRVRRRPTYGADVLGPLKLIWLVLEAPCGKRLVAALPATLQALERHGELRVHPDVRAKLLSLSAATADRLLARERRRLTLKPRGHTKPGTLLKHQIPIRTFTEWDHGRPGFCEIDLVSHDGGLAEGDWIHTLSATDVATGWTETRACRNKAQRHVFSALLHIREALPFPLLGLDSDNGSEFINHQLARYCLAEKITFTRGRPQKKNDQCYVEQKNWHIVRRTVGYLRYDTEEELRVLNDLYAEERLIQNFFSPQMKLLAKTREGARVHKRYDQAQTPYARVLASSAIDDSAKERLRTEFLDLNPAAIQRRVGRLCHRLFQLAQQKALRLEKEVIVTRDLAYLLVEATKVHWSTFLREATRPRLRQRRNPSTRQRQYAPSRASTTRTVRAMMPRSRCSDQCSR